jgi:hypothetical protein
MLSAPVFCGSNSNLITVILTGSNDKSHCQLLGNTNRITVSHTATTVPTKFTLRDVTPPGAVQVHRFFGAT